MRYVITTDTTCDMPQAFLEENELTVMSMAYTVDGKTYTGLEGDFLPPKEFYDRLRGGSMPQTAQVNPDQAEKVFERFLKSGVSVLHIAFSSALSGSYQSTVIAAEELNAKYGDAKVITIDSKCASMGEGLFVYYAVQLKKQGKSLEEAAEWLEAHKLNICHNFTVDDLFHLHRGGRVSKTAAVFGSMLGVKPVLHVDDEGRLIPIQKIRGRKQSLTALVDNMETCMGGMKNDVVFISHGDCLEDAQFVADEVKKRFGIQNIWIDYIGPVIGTHSGAGTVALFFLGKHR
ncbi:MAG: fatty acid-binding protein DegV [Clostridiales bacterium]|nr:MAG: fatty acid-binding protein DegV [Clostridiales bacterium]